MSQLVSPAPRASRGGPVPLSPVSLARCHGQLLLPEMDGLRETRGRILETQPWSREGRG